MTDDAEVVHMAWGTSSAGSVRKALRSQGCRARVIALGKTLSVGPIDPAEPNVRQAWLRANLRSDDPRENWHEPEAPWAQATAEGIHAVYWVCRTDAAEHASFLAFAFRMAGRPFDIIDATELDVTGVGGPSPFFNLGQLRPEEIVASGLGERRRPFSHAESAAAAAAWSQLQRENAPLRIVREGRLVSAPLTHFDAVLTGQVTPQRQPVVKLIAGALHHLCNEMDPPGQGCGAEFLFARVLALGNAGLLDVAGPGPGMRDYEVRLQDARLPA